jgi:hypothetical protein
MGSRTGLIRTILIKGLMVIGIVAGVMAILPGHAHAQSAQTKANADARWGAFWSKFSSAVTNKDRRQFIALTAKDFTDGGGFTIQQWLGSEPNTWASIRRSVRSGTKKYKGDPGDVMRITKDNSLIFEYKRGQWLFWRQLMD